MKQPSNRTLEDRIREAAFERPARSLENEAAGAAMRAVSESVAKEIEKIFEEADNSK